MNLYKGANGEVVEVLLPAGEEEITLTINGAPAEKLAAGTSDGATEKHVPDVKVEDGKVKVQVGSVKHPMLEKHWITNIWMEYPDGTVEKATLVPGDEPVAVFDVKDKHGKATVYEYCNLHGLWKKDVELTK